MFEKQLWKSDILSKDAGFRFRVPTDIFLLCAHDYSTKIYGPFFIYSFFCAQLFDQKLGSSLIISFIWTQPFDQIIWSSFIYSFFSARPFHLKLGSSLIHFFICTQPFDQKLGSSLIYLFYFHTTIRRRIRVFIN